MKRFSYILDPVFIIAFLLYATNRLAIKPALGSENILFWSYFNDLLLIPCALPPLLWLHKKLGLRHFDRKPTIKEILLHLMVWSICFELIAPLLYDNATGDLLDILAYWIGGSIAWIIWNKCKRHGKVPDRKVYPVLIFRGLGTFKARGKD